MLGKWLEEMGRRQARAEMAAERHEAVTKDEAYWKAQRFKGLIDREQQERDRQMERTRAAYERTRAWCKPHLSLLYGVWFCECRGRKELQSMGHVTITALGYNPLDAWEKWKQFEKLNGGIFLKRT